MLMHVGFTKSVPLFFVETFVAQMSNSSCLRMCMLLAIEYCLNVRFVHRMESAATH